MITVNNISLTKQKNTILDNVSLEILSKDFISIIGPNGAGKSTLLKVLLGFEKPDTGTVDKQVGLKIGYMPQKLTVEPLFPISVQRFLNLSKPQPEYLEKTIENIGIQGILSRALSNLSSGELQRVLLARALLNNPDVLMLDEPVQNLDIHGQLQFYELLERLYNDHNLTIVMVSHDLHVVMRATRKVICLFRHICCAGAPANVSQHPRFVELFGQDMSKMLKVYQHDHDHQHTTMAQSC